MNSLIDRYVYDVTRRLPEKERAEVSRELTSNIYDMLSEGAEEDEIREVLRGLGSPASLAEKYRQRPRYLISPAYFDEYIHALKLVLPIVGTIVLVVSMVLGAINATKHGEMVEIQTIVSSMFSDGLSMAFSAVFQALVWTTIGFIIAEHVEKRSDKHSEWNIDELPQIPPIKYSGIPLSDSIVELALTVVFSVIAILVCAGIMPIAFTFSVDGRQIVNLFKNEFLRHCILAIAVTASFSSIECIIKIIYRRWNPIVCATAIISNMIGACVAVVLFSQPHIFTDEFTEFLASFEWGSHDLLRIMGEGISPATILIIIILISTAASCVHAVYKTLKTNLNTAAGLH